MTGTVEPGQEVLIGSRTWEVVSVFRNTYVRVRRTTGRGEQVNRMVLISSVQPKETT